MSREYTESFINLIEKFLEKCITALNFETQFLALWNDNVNNLDADIYNPIKNLFYSVDQFTDLPIEPDEESDDFINEEQLRESAAKTLQDLRALK